MRIYLPPNREGNQNGEVVSMGVTDYIRHLISRADVIRILPINRSPNKNWTIIDHPSGSAPDDTDRFYPLIETYRDGVKTGFHGINATEPERKIISDWLPPVRKDGYINIGKVARAMNLEYTKKPRATNKKTKRR
jgi:hypothetical protein